LAEVIETARRNGAKFDLWNEVQLDRWQKAFATWNGFDAAHDRTGRMTGCHGNILSEKDSLWIITARRWIWPDR
jgi:hypothetical protein